MQVCHRDLKLENTLLDGRQAPRLKICDFGYSKSSVLHLLLKSIVGTPAYIAPEVLLKKNMMARMQMCGHVVLHCTSCSLELTLLKTLRSLGISATQYSEFSMFSIRFHPTFIYLRDVAI